jgi:hypothetical protein
MIKACSILQGATGNSRVLQIWRPITSLIGRLFLGADCDALRPCFATSIRHTQLSVFRHFSFARGNRVLSNSIRSVIFSTPRTGMAVAE